MAQLYKTPAILLNQIDGGERDRLLVFYTENFGWLNIVVRGVKDVKSKLAPCLNLFSRLKIAFVSKKSASLNGNNWLLTDVIEENPFSSIKNSESKFFEAGELSLFLNRFIRAPLKDSRLSAVIFGGFEFLDKQNLDSKELKAFDALFKLRALYALGHLNPEEIILPIFSDEWIFENKEKIFLAEIAKNPKAYKEILDKSEKESQL